MYVPDKKNTYTENGVLKIKPVSLSPFKITKKILQKLNLQEQ